MALAIRSPNGTSTGTVHAASGTLTVSKPTGAAAGDQLFLAIGTNATTGATGVTAPSGWNAVGSLANTKAEIQVWQAPQSVSNLGFTVNSAGSTVDLSWVMLAFTGEDATTPVDATGTGNSNTAANSISVTGFNTVTDLALELIAVVNWNGSAAFTSTGFTVVASSNANCQMALLYANSAVTPAGGTGAKTVSDSASATGNVLCYQQFALRPAASAVAGLPPPPFPGIPGALLTM